MLQLIALFGGTFDPVHHGHLTVANAVLSELSVQQIRFIPCFLPVHREMPGASALQRLAMLKIATENNPLFFIDDCEIKREKPSYTIETLIDIQKRFAQKSLAWVLGNDAWAQFHTWHRFEEILNYTHLIIVNRPHVPLQNQIIQEALLKNHETKNKEDLLHYPHGKIFILKNCHADISATRIRNALVNNTLQPAQIPEKVLNYILENDLY